LKFVSESRLVQNIMTSIVCNLVNLYIYLDLSAIKYSNYRMKEMIIKIDRPLHNVMQYKRELKNNNRE